MDYKFCIAILNVIPIFSSEKGLLNLEGGF